MDYLHRDEKKINLAKIAYSAYLAHLTYLTQHAKLKQK